MSPRRVSQPDYPDSAGGWLSLYRYRVKDASGYAMTVNDLGESLGVSGATVRRWELGNARPSADDVRRVATALYLTPIEAAFLDRAFRSADVEDPPVPAAFSKLAAKILETPNPAVVLDSLYFIRARNAQSDIVLGSRGPSVSEHPFIGLIPDLEAARTAEQQVQRRQLLDLWLLRFWNSTARLCGSAGYRRLLERLNQVSGFAETWSAIALNWPDAGNDVLGAPHYIDKGNGGWYRVLESRAFTPATYFYLEWIPVDDRASRVVAESVEGGEGSLYVSQYTHWSQDPFLEPDGD